MPNKENNQLSPRNEIVFYETADGKVAISVRFEEENIWLTQRHMADLFECSAENISWHLKNIYGTGELDKEATTKDSLLVQKEGNREITRRVVFYSLEAVIAVGYRVNSERGVAFRTWATDKLRNYIHKGFAIDSDRFKKGAKLNAHFFDELLEEIREIRASERMAYQKITDIYATSVDYMPRSGAASRFFASVQNKLHFAITGSTAAEIIVGRAKSDQPNMGLTTWRKAPDGKILPADTSIAKNYLSREEISQLNRIVVMYIDYAEFQAARGKVMTMQDWAKKLDAFLQFNEQELLEGLGKVAHEVAKVLAEKEYEVFRKKQDLLHQSDFDQLLEFGKLKPPESGRESPPPHNGSQL